MRGVSTRARWRKASSDASTFGSTFRATMGKKKGEKVRGKFVAGSPGLSDRTIANHHAFDGLHLAASTQRERVGGGKPKTWNG